MRGENRRSKLIFLCGISKALSSISFFHFEALNCQDANTCWLFVREFILFDASTSSHPGSGGRKREILWFFHHHAFAPTTHRVANLNSFCTLLGCLSFFYCLPRGLIRENEDFFIAVNDIAHIKLTWTVKWNFFSLGKNFANWIGMTSEISFYPQL